MGSDVVEDFGEILGNYLALVATYFAGWAGIVLAGATFGVEYTADVAVSVWKLFKNVFEFVHRQRSACLRFVVSSCKGSLTVWEQFFNFIFSQIELSLSIWQSVPKVIFDTVVEFTNALFEYAKDFTSMIRDFSNVCFEDAYHFGSFVFQYLYYVVDLMNDVNRFLLRVLKKVHELSSSFAKDGVDFCRKITDLQLDLFKQTADLCASILQFQIDLVNIGPDKTIRFFKRAIKISFVPVKIELLLYLWLVKRCTKWLVKHTKWSNMMKLPLKVLIRTRRKSKTVLFDELYPQLPVTTAHCFDTIADVPEDYSKLADKYGTRATAKLQNVEINYIEKGEKTNPLLIFVHGFPDFWYSWRGQIDHYSKKYRVVALDLRGYGQSSKPQGISPYVLDCLVNDLKDIITVLGYRSCTLIGHDWGATIIYALLLKHPELVEKYVTLNSQCPYTGLINDEFLSKLCLSTTDATGFPISFCGGVLQNARMACGGSGDEGFGPGEDGERIKLSGEIPAGGLVAYGKSFPSSKRYETFLQIPVLPEIDMVLSDPFEKIYPNDEDRRIYKYAFRNSDSYTFPVNHFRANYIELSKYYERTIEDLQDRKFPAGLAIAGDEDDRYDEETFYGCKKVPNLQVMVLSGEGHLVHQVNPQLVNRVIDVFLR